MRQGKSVTLLMSLALAAAWAAPGSGRTEEPGTAVETVPRVAGQQAERVTVDVVVLDDDGAPVKGLRRDDFLVFDEGERRTIDSFEMVDRTMGREAPEPELSPIATNVVAPQGEVRARTFFVIFDDLHLTRQYAQSAKKAVLAFLDKGTADGDRVTLITTSGSTWWTTEMPRGREDLVAILKRLEGRLIRETAQERLTDYEAFQIFYYHDTRIARRVEDRLEQYGTKSKSEMSNWQSDNMMDMVMRGWIHPYIEARAMQTYFQARTRMEASLRVLERAARALSGNRDRKALVLMSEGFVDDPSQDGIRRLVETARQVNAALYFVDVSGLRILDPMYSAELPGLDREPGDLMGAIADLSREGEGAVALAENTGGFAIRDSNDFERGAVRIGRESQSYYLIGYDPGDIPHDGNFRKIKVKVRGDYTVHARRGYYAPTADGTARELAMPEHMDPELQHALDSPTFERGIPLRMTTYVMDDFGADWVRVIMVADVDVSKLGFKEVEGARLGALDTLAVISDRGSDEVQRDDQRVDLRLKPGAGPGPVWYSFIREFGVPAGRHQARLVVRDPASGSVGSVVHEFDVPGREGFRVSTPVLTDTMAQAPGGNVSPALLARRTFAPGTLLYCRFDVFGAKRGQVGMPRVRSGYALKSDTGETVSRAVPTLIEPTSMGALARMVQIPLLKAPPGAYQLVLTVEDELGGESKELVEPLVIAAPRRSALD